ncbi:MAG: hypothetical protein IKO27_05925 [Ruminococcus sp.]|nr:hypothetical protein [Ruminococcus sp.]
MTNKEIKAKALSRISGKWGTTVSLSVFKSAFLLVFVVSEIILYLLFDHFGIEYNYYPSFMIGTDLGRFMLSIRLMLLIFLYFPEDYIMRRLILDLYFGRNFVETRRYIQYNSREIHPKATVSLALPVLLKIVVFVPIMVGVYGIYYWGWAHRDDTLTTLGLFVFMLSIGFTIVWAGVFIRFCISLAMTRYIMLLNPRANIFDACDLSRRIMDGKHMRYLSFVLSFVKYLPALLLFYPIYVLEPYYKMSCCVLAEEFMGDYWQDKYPAMIKRWNKYAH